MSAYHSNIINLDACTRPHAADGSVCTECAAYQRTQRALREARAAVVRLQQEERAALTKLNSSHDPMQRIPLEVISEIFEFATLALWQIMPPIAPLALGRICKAWRTFAWSTPSLWNEIDFCLYPGYNAELNSLAIRNASLALRFELLRDWVARSGNLPLTFNVSGGDGLDDDIISSEALLPIVDILAECAPRLVASELQLPASILRLLEDLEAPKLQRFTLCHVLDDVHDPPINLQRFTNAVKSLEINWFPENTVKTGNQNLRSLRLFDCSSDVCLDMLRAASSCIAYCSLNIVQPAIPSYHPTLTSPFPLFGSLRRLEISYNDHRTYDLSPLFAQSTMPHLRVLWINCGTSQRHATVDPHTLARFLHRSACPLDELWADTPAWDAAGLQVVLQEVPSLTCLQLKKGGLLGVTLDEIFQVVFPTGRLELEPFPIIKTFEYSTHWSDAGTVVLELRDSFSQLQRHIQNTSRSVRVSLSLEIQFRAHDFSPAEWPWLPLDTLAIIEELQAAGNGVHIPARVDGRDGWRNLDFVKASTNFHRNQTIDDS